MKMYKSTFIRGVIIMKIGIFKNSHGQGVVEYVLLSLIVLLVSAPTLTGMSGFVTDKKGAIVENYGGQASDGQASASAPGSDIPIPGWNMPGSKHCTAIECWPENPNSQNINLRKDNYPKEPFIDFEEELNGLAEPWACHGEENCVAGQWGDPNVVGDRTDYVYSIVDVCANNGINGCSYTIKRIDLYESPKNSDFGLIEIEGAVYKVTKNADLRSPVNLDEPNDNSYFSIEINGATWYYYDGDYEILPNMHRRIGDPDTLYQMSKMQRDGNINSTDSSEFSQTNFGKIMVEASKEGFSIDNGYAFDYRTGAKTSDNKFGDAMIAHRIDTNGNVETRGIKDIFIPVENVKIESKNDGNFQTIFGNTQYTLKKIPQKDASTSIDMYQIVESHSFLGPMELLADERNW